MNVTDVDNPRHEIEEAIDAGDLSRLLKINGTLHGHFCLGSALGVKAATKVMRELGIKSSTGMEEIVAIVEINSCFSDGVQIVTGCSFGNNALIYRDLGKTAFTLAKRNGEGLRICVKTGYMEELSPEMAELSRKIVVERKGTEADQARMSELRVEVAFKLLDVPDLKVFDIRRVKIEVPPYARIFASAKCSVCGENVMETRARIKNGQPVCLACSGQEFYQLAGDGISVIHQ